MNTCNVDKKGIYAAYVRAKEWESRSKTLKNKKASYYSNIARKAKMLLEQKK
jgi:hypothetical protein